MSKKFIVTGGAGFIGNNIVRELNRKGEEDIIIVDELDHDAKQANLEGVAFTDYIDKTAFRALMHDDEISPVDTVIHMGACSSTTETNEEFLKDNNFGYTRELCEWSVSNGTRFIYASSAATYGDGSLGYSDEDEVTPTLKPLNLYGESKQMFDVWALEHGMLDKIVGLKYFNVYGPHEDHKGDMRSVINKAYAQILETGGLKLFKSHRPDYEDGKQERDFVFVKDAVDVTLYFDENPDVSGIFNCGTGIERTWLDLGNAVFAAMGREPNIEFIDMPESIRDKYQYHTCADASKLRSAGFSADFTSIEEGARQYVQDYLAL
ncbi:ADP-glyceromanno-heptose 6-epimerase [bacterium E08(2017)]|nr:ADP-glyceromanno-heptose 6-epimerase [bacterium E08(2017)]